MTALRLANRVAIVTGSSSGLGRAIATTLAKNGASVICADLSPVGRQTGTDEPSTHEAIIHDGGKATFVKADVSDSESVQNMVQTAVDTYGRLDILVNNAGISFEVDDPIPIQDAPDERFDITMKVNARGPFLGCKYASRQMLRQDPIVGKDRGWIVNISSGLALVAKEGSPCYAISKGAMSSLTRAVAIDLAPHHIHCNAVLPGFVETPMISDRSKDSEKRKALQNAEPFGRLGDPMETANAVLFLCSDEANGISGVNLPVDGALTVQLKI